MNRIKEQYRPHPGIIALLTMVIAQASIAAQAAEWERKEVNWRISRDRQIKAIYYPADQNIPLLENRTERKPVHLEQRTIGSQAEQTFAMTAGSTGVTAFANVLNSPPIDGFTPYVTMAITDECSGGRIETIQTATPGPNP